MRKIPFLIFYLASGYVAAYGFALANPSSAAPLIGASGAMAGVLGAYLVLYPRAKVWSLVPFLFFIPLRIPAWAVLGLWFVLQWAYSAGISTEGAPARSPTWRMSSGSWLALWSAWSYVRRAPGPPAAHNRAWPVLQTVTRWAWWSISPGRGRAAADGPGTGCPGSWAGVRQTG